MYCVAKYNYNVHIIITKNNLLYLMQNELNEQEKSLTEELSALQMRQKEDRIECPDLSQHHIKKPVTVQHRKKTRTHKEK